MRKKNKEPSLTEKADLNIMLWGWSLLHNWIEHSLWGKQLVYKESQIKLIRMTFQKTGSWKSELLIYKKFSPFVSCWSCWSEWDPNRNSHLAREIFCECKEGLSENCPLSDYKQKLSNQTAKSNSESRHKINLKMCTKITCIAVFPQSGLFWLVLLDVSEDMQSFSCRVLSIRLPVTPLELCDAVPLHSLLVLESAFISFFCTETQQWFSWETGVVGLLLLWLSTSLKFPFSLAKHSSIPCFCCVVQLGVSRLGLVKCLLLLSGLSLWPLSVPYCLRS